MARLKFIIPILILALLWSCSSPKPSTQNPKIPKKTENYTSAFPQSDVSELLKDVQQSVVRVVATGYYDSYSFGDGLVTMDEIQSQSPEQLANITYTVEESTAGTAIILDQYNSHYLLITAEHVVAFPDTATAYREGNGMPENTFLKSISIKRRQTNLAYTGQEIKSFEVIASNNQQDLALLDLELEENSNLDPYPLSLSFGDTDYLQLGSFLYMLGFPKGYAMVTRGLASSSESWNDRFFVTDAVFNPGISGGPIMASRDNFRSLEWVGMVSSATASRENVLVPRPSTEKYSNILRPYNDSVFVEEKTRINYGIAQAVPINQIKEFLLEHEELISRRGYRLIRKRNLSR